MRFEDRDMFRNKIITKKDARISRMMEAAFEAGLKEGEEAIKKVASRLDDFSRKSDPEAEKEVWTKVAHAISESRESNAIRRYDGFEPTRVSEDSQIIREAYDRLGREVVAFLKQKFDADRLPPSIDLSVSKVSNVQTRYTGLFKKSARVAYGDVSVKISHPALMGKTASVSVSCDGDVKVITSGFTMDGFQFPVNKEGWEQMVRHAQKEAAKSEPVHLIVRKFSQKFPEGYYESLGVFEDDAALEAMLRQNGVIYNYTKTASFNRAIEPVIFDESDVSKVIKIAKALSIKNAQQASGQKATVVTSDTKTALDVAKKLEEETPGSNEDITVVKDPSGQGALVTAPQEALKKRSANEAEYFIQLVNEMRRENGEPPLTPEEEDQMRWMHSPLSTRAAILLDYARKYIEEKHPNFHPNDKVLGQIIRGHYFIGKEPIVNQNWSSARALLREAIDEEAAAAAAKPDAGVSVDQLEKSIPKGIEAAVDKVVEDELGQAEAESIYSKYLDDSLPSRDPDGAFYEGTDGQYEELIDLLAGHDDEDYSKTAASAGVPYSDKQNDPPTRNQGPSATKAKLVGPAGPQKINKNSPSDPPVRTPRKSDGRGDYPMAVNETMMSPPTKNQGPSAARAKFRGPAGEQKMWANEPPKASSVPAGSGTPEEFMTRDRGEESGNVRNFFPGSGGNKKPGKGRAMDLEMGRYDTGGSISNGPEFFVRKTSSVEDFPYPF